MTETFDQGQTIYPVAEFTDIDGEPIDPTVVATVVAPDGTVTTPSTTNPAVGEFRFELTLDQAGVWRWRFVGTTDEGSLVCTGSACANAWVSVEA